MCVASVLHGAETELLPSRRKKKLTKKMIKRNDRMVFSSFFSPLPINKSYFVQFLNSNRVFLAILIEFPEGSHPIVDI